MNWQIILFIFFIICSATSTKVPENHEQQSSDGPSNQTAKSDENTSQVYNNSYKVEDQFDDKHLLEIPNNNDCFSSIDMKRTIVVILESVRRSPEVLNNLIDKLKSQIDQEPGLVRANNDNYSDSRRSILLQLHLPDNSNPLSSTTPCARSITELAKSAHKTYMDFKNTPACMKYLLSENEATANLDLHTKDTNPDVNTLVSLILKQLRRYDGLNVQKPGPTQVTVPENYFQNWNVLKPTMPVHPSTADKLGYQYIPSGSPFANGPPETGIKQLTGFITQSHASNTPLTFTPESLPESSLDLKPNRAPLQAFQPILPTEHSSSIMIQDPYFLVTNYHGDKPQESLAQILGYTTTEHPIFGNYHDIFSTYPKINKPAHDSLIEFPEKRQNGHDSVNIPKFVTNEIPIRVEDVPIHDLGYSVYPETHSVYPAAKQPEYMDTTPILPKTNIVTLILELLRNKPSQNHIKTIKTAFMQNKAAFEPTLFKTLLALLDSYEGGLVDSYKVYEIYKFLLQPPNILWSEEKRNLFWQLLQPNESGQINSRNIDVIVSLIQTMNQGSLDKSKEFLPLSMLTEQEHTHPLLNQNKKKILRPDQEKTLSFLVESAKNDKDNYKYINIVNTLANLDQVPYLIAENINVIFSLLKPNYGGKIDARVVDIINQIILQKNQNILTPEDIDVILSFLKPDVNGYVNSKRLDIVAFILMNTAQVPQLRKAIIQLLDTDVIKSKYVDILLALYRERILSIQLLEAMITLLKQEKTGYIDDYIINKIYVLLAPYKNGHPKIVSDIFRQLRTTRSPKSKPASAEVNATAIWKPDDMNIHDSFNTQQQVPDLKVEGFVTPNKVHDWEEYGPIVKKATVNDNLLFKLLNMPLRDPSAYTATLDKFGFLELTYMINKPVYRPMYYVKYKIPIDNFLTSLKAQDPQLSANPMILLQKLIIEGNMSEVSPNLKGLNKDDILKMTFKDGDLVQAKLLDKQNSNLNDQIKLVDNLNANITPPDLLEQNNRNTAQSFHQIGGNTALQPNLEYFKNMHTIAGPSNYANPSNYAVPSNYAIPSNYAVPPQMIVKRPVISYAWHPNQNPRDLVSQSIYASKTG